MIRPDNRAFMAYCDRRLFALLLMLWLPAAAAETSYVVDKLLVGVHEDKNLDSAIVKVLPTGTALEVIERDGELALIEDPEKVRGWVDSAYLTNEQPAVLRLATLERDKARLEQQLKAIKAAPAGGAASPDAASSAQVNELTKENTDLKGKLSEQRLRAEKLQTELAGLRAEIKTNSAPPDARIVELERGNESLKRALDDAEDQVAELSARASLKTTAAMVPLVLGEYSTSIFILVLIIIALAFGAGIYVLDVLNRRRHGGFRV